MADSNSKKTARTPQQLALDAFGRFWQREAEQSRPALTVSSPCERIATETDWLSRVLARKAS